jgi:hypothetical protein
MNLATMDWSRISCWPIGHVAKSLSRHCSVWLAVLGFLAVCQLPTVSGIKCWECNSAFDKRCGDPFQNMTSELVDCDQRTPEMEHLPLDKNGEKYQANICRKTYQSIREEVRVIRSCGWLPNKAQFADRTCYTKTGTFQVMVFHCVCHEDGCNSGSYIALSLSLLLVSLASFRLF